MPLRSMYCYTCDSDEQHRPLTGKEEAWLRQRTGQRNVDGHFMCTAPACRNIRTGFDKHPYEPVIRVPPSD